MVSIRVQFGEDEIYEEKSFEFDGEAQLKVFLFGLQQGCGYSDARVFMDGFTSNNGHDGDAYEEYAGFPVVDTIWPRGREPWAGHGIKITTVSS